MTAPRQILPGTTYLLTRRCARRQLLLRPSELVNQIFLYCIARAAEKAGVLIHAYGVLSNHLHIVLTDPDGRLPEFMAHVNGLVGPPSPFGLRRDPWSSNSKDRAVARAAGGGGPPMIMTLTHSWAEICSCVIGLRQAALLESWRQWPGAISLPADYLKGTVEVERPGIFFRKNGKTPAKVKLELMPPAGIKHEAKEAFVEMLSDELELRERDIRLQHKLAGRSFLGRRAVLAQDPFSYPLNKEPRRHLSPRIACRDKWRRIEAIKRLKRFYSDYYEALAVFLAGVRDVVFPAGTYWMVKHAGAQCASPG